MRATLADFGGREVWRTEEVRRLGPGQAANLAFHPHLRLLGFYKLVLTASDPTDGESCREFLTLGLIDPVTYPRPLRQDGRFGLTFFCRTPELATLAAKIGITWSRDSIHWSSMEPQRGKYVWAGLDGLVGNAAFGNLWTMPVNGASMAPLGRGSRRSTKTAGGRRRR